jgi:hypothetical protein
MLARCRGVCTRTNNADTNKRRERHNFELGLQKCRDCVVEVCVCGGKLNMKVRLYLCGVRLSVRKLSCVRELC